MIQLFKWRNNDNVYIVHDIIEIESWFSNIAQTSRSLKIHKVYDVSMIMHDAYFVSREKSKNDDVQLVNSWINFEKYNKIFDSKFLENNKMMIERYENRFDFNQKN